MSYGSLNRTITPEDIKSKLLEIQGGATEQVAEARATLINVATAVGAVLIVGVFVLGRRAGRKSSTIIELKRF